VSVVCQAEVFATGRSLVQRNPTEGVCVCVCVDECDRKATIIRWHRPTMDCCAMGKKLFSINSQKQFEVAAAAGTEHRTIL